MDGYNLYKRLRDSQNDYLYFLSHHEIDCTNNISECQLRKFKRKQKQAVVLRSDTGGQHICDALTIIETGLISKAAPAALQTRLRQSAVIPLRICGKCRYGTIGESFSPKSKCGMYLPQCAV